MKNQTFPLSEICLDWTNKIFSNPLSQFFRKPYKPMFEDTDYFEIIKNPMDLTTVKLKLSKGDYYNVSSWENDIRLIFDNAILYNGESHILGSVARYFKQKLDKFLKAIQYNNSRNYESHVRSLYDVIYKTIKEIPDEYGIEYDYEPPEETGEFGIERFSNIKIGLNQLCDEGKGGDLLKAIHRTDQDYKANNLAEIDVATLARSSLLEIENIIKTCVK